jgi:hypothetical protein
MKRYRFQFLLIALFLLILCLPMLPILGGWGRYVATLLFSVMLLSAVVASAEKRSTGFVVMALFLIAFSL